MQVFRIPACVLLTAALVTGAASAQVASAQAERQLRARADAAVKAMKEGRFDDAAASYRSLLKALPNNPDLLSDLATAQAMGGHQADAVATLRTLTRVAPARPRAWYSLGHAYNQLAQDSMSTFNDRPGDQPWRQLLLADALMSDGRLTDAFALYRSTLEAVPSMMAIHEWIARIYEQTGHQDWAAKERAALPSAAECASPKTPALSEPQASRRVFCDFRAARYRAALDGAAAGSDPESRYWQARAAVELARAAFNQLDALPDSRERREVRATMARAERRYGDAIIELQAALKLAPGDPDLMNDLGTTYYFAKQYDKAVATLLPLVKTHQDDPRLLATCGDALLQLQRIDDAIPLLQRSAALDTFDPAVRLSLAGAYIAKDYFAAAIPLLELDLAEDTDGSVHVQLARAYKGVGNEEKSAQLLQRSQELQKAAQERSAAKGQRTITPPK
jgi:predicted Zn-dependent protease